MNTDTSPATEARTLWRASSRPSPTTSTSSGVPKTSEEADKLLSHAERLLRDGRMTGEWVSQLTRFLGANSAAWTSVNRERLRAVLASLGEAGIESVVAAMSRLPRTDILDEGEFVLRSLPREAAPSLRRLLDFEQRSLAPSVKTSILRAVARLDWVNSVQTARAALNDLDPEVRDAAASLFAELGDAGSRVALEKRLERESNDFVRQSIREAIDSLQS